MSNIEITQTILEEIEQLSAVNYSYAQMALYLNLPKALFIQEAKTKDSDIWDAIQRGALQADFTIQEKLLENAKTGNITAAQTYEKNKAKKETENLKARIFYGE